MEESYKGYIKLSEEQTSKFYAKENIDCTLYENEYVIINNDEVHCYQNGNFRRIEYPIIKNDWSGIIKPKDVFQQIAMDMLKDKTSKVKLICSPAACGKDYLMFNQALELIEKGKFDKLVYVRPNVTLANVPSIGYLPNGVEEKLAWTLAPLYDKCGGEEGVDRLVRENRLEMVPLLFIRGRSFENSIVYVTEGQNIDTEIAKVLISRIGEGSELWINGDYRAQCDSKVFNQDNGLVRMIERLKGDKLFAYVHLENVYRSKVAELASKLNN